MAFSCKDPSLTYLNRYGYNVVTLPRTGLDPLLSPCNLERGRGQGKSFHRR